MTSDPARPRLSLRPGLAAAGIVLAIYGGLALTVDFPSAALGIQSDEATYYMMGHSLAEDGDLAYRREDLARVWREFPSGPAGVFLKKGRSVTGIGLTAHPPFIDVHSAPDPDAGRLYFGKSFIYPLIAAPFVLVFGTNGFLVLHALLLSLVILSGYLFLHARMQATVAVLLATAFVMATVVPVYFVWITPELFNFSLIVLAYTCWLFKEVADSSTVPRGARWLLSPSTDIAAAILLGIATFSKPPNLLLFLPIALWHVWQRQWTRCLLTGFVFVAITGGLFGANLAISGDWNYQGGERSTFYAAFPFQTPNTGYDVGAPRARDEALTDILFDPHVFWINLVSQPRVLLRGPVLGARRVLLPGGLRSGEFSVASEAARLAVPRAGRLSAPDRVFRHHPAVHVVRRRRLRRQSLLRRRLRRVPVPVAAD